MFSLGMLLALERGEAFQHLRLGRLQHTVQPAQDDQRQHHIAVLSGLVRAAQQIGHAPDKTNLVVEIVH